MSNVSNEVTRLQHAVTSAMDLLSNGDTEGGAQVLRGCFWGTALSVPTTAALRDVAAERERQQTAEGKTPELDDDHEFGDLAAAAGIYALHVGGGLGTHDYFHHQGRDVPRGWPFEPSAWKPKDERRDLVRAAALILAEIERLDRAVASEAGATASQELADG